MKRKEYKYPRMLAALMAGGIGRRKARRMIKHAVFIGHKVGNMGYRYDDDSISGFCIWVDQGKYMNSWLEANNAKYAR